MPTDGSAACPICLGVEECRHIPVPSQWIAWDGTVWTFDAAGALTIEEPVDA